MPTLEAAIEWVEIHQGCRSMSGRTKSTNRWTLHEIDPFKGSKPDTLIDLKIRMEIRSCRRESIYSRDIDGCQSLN